MRGPDRFVAHLRTENYHPRSDAHSNALCEVILDDLLDSCEPLADRAEKGEVVYQLNHTVQVGFQNWNIDLAVGPPPGSPLVPKEGVRIREDVPVVIQLAVEAKGVMTEHGKARKNRLRDLHAFHTHAHDYDRKVVAGGIVVVNVSSIFWSPLRSEDDITRHQNIERIGKETVELYRNIPLRDHADSNPGLEALSVVVVSHDNLDKHPSVPVDGPTATQTSLIRGTPAPQPGDPLSYDTFIHRLSEAYRNRWT